MSEPDPITQRIIHDVERRLAKYWASYAYNGGYGPAAAARMAEDLRRILDVAKRAVEPNVTIDIIRDPNGPIERITATASSVAIETYGAVRLEPVNDPPPRKHDVLSVWLAPAGASWPRTPIGSWSRPATGPPAPPPGGWRRQCALMPGSLNGTSASHCPTSPIVSQTSFRLASCAPTGSPRSPSPHTGKLEI